MGWVIVVTNLTLDGVMQAPGRPDEDTRGDFKHGGWAAPFAAMMQAGEAFANLGGFLFGRRTYDDFARVWPDRTDNPFTDVLNSTQKYVASTTSREPLPWTRSTLLQGDAMKAIGTLKKPSQAGETVIGVMQAPGRPVRSSHSPVGAGHRPPALHRRWPICRALTPPGEDHGQRSRDRHLLAGEIQVDRSRSVGDPDLMPDRLSLPQRRQHRVRHVRA